MKYPVIRNVLFSLSLTVSLVSAGTACVSKGGLKTASYFGLGVGIVNLLGVQLLSGAIDKYCDEITKELQLEVDESKQLSRNQSKQLDNLTRDNEVKAAEIKRLTELKEVEVKHATEAKESIIRALQKNVESIQSKLESKDNQLETKNAELTEARQANAQLREKLESIGQFNASESHRIVRETFNRQVKKVNAVINALIRNHPDYTEDLQSILDEFESSKIRFIKKIEEYEAINTFDDLLDIGLELQELIIDKSFELRSKAQQLIIRDFASILNDSVEYEEVEQMIGQLTAQAGEQIETVKANLEADKRAIASEWVVSNDQIVNKYETEYTETLNTAKQAVSRLQKLEDELTELRKPLQMYGSSTYAVAANSISGWYYSKYGYILDAITWEEIETGYKLLFAIRRNPGLTDKEVEADNSLEQVSAFTNALHGTTPKFEFNRQNSTVTLTVQLRRVVKTSTEKLEADVNKIWVPSSKFESYVRKFERVRITAGSTGGKSPTAKNLALAIMNSRQGKGEIKLYDPQHGSKKDFWGMPKAGISHEDNFTGLKEVCELIDSRRNSRDHEFKLYIFDEVDNTIANLGKQSSDYRNLLKISIKEGSHADIGVIYIGQSADANELPGMTHSNWNNCVQLHIGSNAGTAIEKLTTLTSEDKTRLLEQYRKIQEYCDRRNEELGLDIFTDPAAYRFALVVPLTGLPKFIQLPDFDSYSYSEVMGKQADIKTELSPTVKVQTAPKLRCDKCGSTEIASRGKRYVCGGCGSSTGKHTGRFDVN